MINTHLPDADAKYQKFISELKANDYFPSDEKSDLYKKLQEKAKQTFVEETTVKKNIFFLLNFKRKHYQHNTKIWQIKNSKQEIFKQQLNFIQNLFD